MGSDEDGSMTPSSVRFGSDRPKEPEEASEAMTSELGVTAALDTDAAANRQHSASSASYRARDADGVRPKTKDSAVRRVAERKALHSYLLRSEARNKRLLAKDTIEGSTSEEIDHLEEKQQKEKNSDSDANSEYLSSNDMERNVKHVTDSTQILQPHKSILKRKLEHNEELQAKKKKESIKFDKVTVYYFTRAQGFSCVPSDDGCTLGMEREHCHKQHFSLSEYALEKKRRLHKQILEHLKSERHSLQAEAHSSGEDTEKETTRYSSLKSVPAQQRRALLRAAGVKKIEGSETDECKDIRTSRKFPGCVCKGGCRPSSCSCSLGGIKCQVDRFNFPCRCSKYDCGNTSGWQEYNRLKVKTHINQTLLRLDLEKKKENQGGRTRIQWTAKQKASNSTRFGNATYDSYYRLIGTS